MLLHAEEDNNACSDREDRQGLQYEVRDDINLDGVLLVIQGEANLGYVLEVINWCVTWEELVPNEKNEFQEGPEMDCPKLPHAFGLVARPEA